MNEVGTERVKAAFQGIRTDRLPRGEVWLGEDVLKRASLDDNLEGRLKLVRHLKQDLICISVSEAPRPDPSTGYRYFPVSALDDVTKETDLFVMAVMDGPFQRLSVKTGLMSVLTGWVREKENLLKAYENERKEVLDLLQRCLEHSVHGVVIADDLAGGRSLFLNPLDIQRFFSPFYHEAVAKIHEASALALFHSCGNISKLVPQLVSHGFDGLAAVQDRENDLMGIKGRYGSRLLLMGGIEGEMLEQKDFASSDLDEFKERLEGIAHKGGLILSSSCGLYSGKFLERIREIYGLI